MIAGGFGTAWTFWAASGMTATAATAARIVGVVIGVLVVAGAGRRWHAARSDGGAPRHRSASMFGSRGYQLSVTAEVVALFVGNAVLGATGHSGYVAAWTALVVGVHFLGFGRLFTPMFYWLAAAFLVAALAGAAAGAASGSTRTVEASTGLIAAASLFLAGGWGLLPLDSSGTRATRS